MGGLNDLSYVIPVAGIASNHLPRCKEATFARHLDVGLLLVYTGAGVYTPHFRLTMEKR